MVFTARHPISADVEDTVYACRSCGAELIRTVDAQDGQARHQQNLGSGVTR